MSCPDLKAFLLGELSQPDQQAVRQHVQTCDACHLEWDRLKLTTATLRKIPDEEIPVRIRFVSDKVFEPAWWHRFAFFSSSRFATALVVPALLISGALFGSRWHSGQTPVSPTLNDAQIEARIQKAVNARLETELPKSIDARIQTAVAKAVSDVNHANEERTRTMLADFQTRARSDREGLVRAVESEYRWVDQKLNQVVYSANEKIPVLSQ